MTISSVIGEHTRIKHELLRRYVKPWMAILFSTQAKHGFPELLFYIDGFSGPGVYYTDTTRTSTCSGSPIIVADIANKYIQAKDSRQIRIFCIDNNEECVESLRGQLKSINNFKQNWEVYHSTFDEKISEILDEIDNDRLGNQPMFIFIDPFGYTAYPVNILKRIMLYPRAELFINFMIYDLIRFCEVEAREQALTEQFGCLDFKEVTKCSDPDEKQTFLLNLYINKSLMGIANSKFVMPFRVNTPGQGTRPRYYLIHASNNVKALKEMKNGMARISQSDYKFEAIGIKPTTLDLFEELDEVKIKRQITEFVETTQGGSALYEDIEDWAYIYTSGVSKTIKIALLELEKEGEVEIHRLPRQRATTVAEGATVSLSNS